MDISLDKNLTLKVETFRFGVFKFQLGFDSESFEFKLLLQRVKDAQNRFASSPLSSIAERLEKEVVVSSIFGTDNIEGGELSEEETAEVLELTPQEIQTIQQQRVMNIKHAYDFIKNKAKEVKWELTLNDILQVHKLISNNLDGYFPAILRDNPKDTITRVGNKEHGGIYKPPQFGGDVKLLLTALLDWNQKLIENNVSALIRAPLIHLYFELIHPFWDGNGRVGRVIEAGILHADGFRYSPFAQAKYYLNNIHAYFSLFNTSRKSANKNKEAPNAPFVSFFLVGMLETINTLHDRANKLIGFILFDQTLYQMKQNKKINERQFDIIKIIINYNGLNLTDLRQLSKYQSLYKTLTDKTKSRDLKKLRELNLLTEIKNKLYPGFMTSL